MGATKESRQAAMMTLELLAAYKAALDHTLAALER